MTTTMISVNCVLIPLKSGKFLNLLGLFTRTVNMGLNPFEVREVSKLVARLNV